MRYRSLRKIRERSPNKGAFVMSAESMDIYNLLSRSQILAQGKRKDGDE